MKFISSIDQDISWESEANEWDIPFNTRNKFRIFNIRVKNLNVYWKKVDKTSGIVNWCLHT